MSPFFSQRTWVVTTALSLAISECCLCPVVVLGEEGVTPHHLVGHEEAPLLQRVQDVIDDWDPRKLVNPLVVTTESEEVTTSAKGGNTEATTKVVMRKQLRRPDLAQFVADLDAVETLGKAFFWEMQAGSDFRRLKDGTMVGTACASCHYRHGADARNRHTLRIPYVAWEHYQLHQSYPLEFGQRQESFPVAVKSVQEVPFQAFQPAGPLSLIVGSQGVESFVFRGFKDQGDDASGKWKDELELSEKRSLAGFKHLPDWAMFVDADFMKKANGSYAVTERARFRQITNRNSPSVINSGFADRLFHDGRAESTFNGFSIFGDADPREVIHRRRVRQELDVTGKVVREIVDIVPVKIAITKAALASQAVGPIVNDVEMSYVGRQFPNVAYKLLDAEILRFQEVAPSDSTLGNWPIGKNASRRMKYRDLIRRAFRREWWDDSALTTPPEKEATPRAGSATTPLVLLRDCEEDGDPYGTLMEANFSLYWGLAIMFYEASLVSNQSPFDDMMRGRTEKVEAKWNAVKSGSGPDDQLQPIRRDQSTPQPPPEHISGTAVFQHGFRVFLNRGCVDCHDGPLMSELYERLPEAQQFPIHHEVERTLLPNSRADALAINFRLEKEALIKKLKMVVTDKLPTARHRAEKIAIELDCLRDEGKGERRVLFTKILNYLESAFPGTASHELRAVGNEVTNYLFAYEKRLPSLVGNRTFFTEAERVLMAEAMTDPVLIEKMPIPNDQWPTRPKLPFSPPFAGELYAFYDLGFYNLGVSLPRYDRGIGDKKGSLLPLEEALEHTLAALSESANPDDQKAVEEIKKSGLQKAAQILEEVEKDTIKLGNAKDRFQEAIEQRHQAPSTSSPGNAYRFNRKWFSERFKSEGKPRIPEGSPSRTSSSGSLCKDPDVDFKGKHFDTSWDRSDIPFGAKGDPNLPANEIVPGPGHRNVYYFLSRARRLVSSEEQWGYRKPFLHDNELAFWGSFKTPTLRNVELTAPYMHNGRFMTLMDVVEFYENDGPGEPAKPRPQLPRALKANPDKHPAIGDIDLNDSDKRALVFFLLCLTDDRVRHEQGPFDHPALTVVNGYEKVGPNDYKDSTISIPSVGANGHADFVKPFPSDR